MRSTAQRALTCCLATSNCFCTPTFCAKVAQLPGPLLKLRDVLVSKGVFDDTNLPDCCCINVYTPGMWLPPHVDNLEFARPFCTVSLLSDQTVVFGDGACALCFDSSHHGVSLGWLLSNILISR